MCDAYAQAMLLGGQIHDVGGKGKMDIDKETVQLAAVVGGVVIAVASLIFDGDLGYAMGTGVLTMAGTAVGYLFGSKSGKEVEKQ